MKTCTKCGHANKDEAKFCGACGSKLEAPAPVAEQKPGETLCPVCGAKNRPGVHFCGYCGANLSQMSEGAPTVAQPTAPPPVDATPEPTGAATEPSPVAAGGPPGAVEAPEAAPAASVPRAEGALLDTSPAVVPEPAALAAQAPLEPKAVATCGHCGTVIRFCPCCGQPLFEGDLNPPSA